MKNKILLLFVLLIPSLGFGEDIKIEIITDLNASTQTIIVDNPATKKTTLVMQCIDNDESDDKNKVSFSKTFKDYWDKLGKKPAETTKYKEIREKLDKLTDKKISLFEKYPDYYKRLREWGASDQNEPEPKKPKDLAEAEEQIDRKYDKLVNSEVYLEYEEKKDSYYKKWEKPYREFYAPFWEIFGEVYLVNRFPVEGIEYRSVFDVPWYWSNDLAFKEIFFFLHQSKKDFAMLKNCYRVMNPPSLVKSVIVLREIN